MARPKFGGRKPGTPNRRTWEVQKKLAELGCDPIEGMAQLALDERNTPEFRGRMFAELAQYVAPKRKAVEHTGADGGPLQAETTTLIDVTRLTREERNTLKPLLAKALGEAA